MPEDFRTQKPALALALIVCLLAIAIGGAGYAFFDRLKATEKAEATAHLASSGKRRAEQLAAFLNERRGDARLLAELLGAGAAQPWWQGRDKPLPAAMRQPLRTAMAAYGYIGALVLDAEGQVRFSAGSSTGLSDTGKAIALRALDKASPVFSELHFADPAAPELFLLDTFAPIMGADGVKALGVLVLRGNWDQMFALTRPWPDESRSAEYLLVRKSGGEVLYLNQLRHQKRATERLRAPLTGDARSPAWPAIRAVQGHYGALESVDYRGQAVLAYTLPVPLTDWSMVAKVDADDALEALRRLEAIALISVLIIVLAFALLLAGSWRWRKRLVAREDRVLRESRERFEKAFQASPDSITLVTLDNGIFVEVNSGFERFTGYSAAEAMGRTARDLNLWMDPAQRAFMFAELQAGRSVSGLEARIRRKDGEMRVGLRFATRVEIGGVPHVLSIMRDITEQKKAEEALRASEEKFSKAFHASPDSIALSKLETGEFIEVNEGFENMSGYSRDEAIGRTAMELGLWTQTGQRAALIAHLTSGGAVRNLETRLRRKDGEERVVQISLEAIELGGEKCMLTIGRDTTETKFAEQALQRERDFAQRLIDIAPVIMVLLDVEGRIQHVNPYFERLSGYRLDQVKGKEWFTTFLPARDQDRIRKLFKSAAQDAPTRGNVNPIVTRSGEEREIEWHDQVMRDDRGSIAAVLAIGQDVTERRYAEDALRASEERLNQAQRIAKVGNWELNLVHGALSWSDEIFRLFEIDKSKFGATYEAFLNAVHPEDREAVNAAYTQSLENREPYQITHRLLMADGRIKYVHERCESEFDAAGKPLRSVGTVQDVTDLKRAEEAIRALNEELEQRVRERTANLEAANRELETFTYSASHDLKGPLRGIDGYSRLLLTKYSDKLDDEGRRCLQNVRQAAQQMGQLIEDLLAYSRLERRDMQAGEIDPQALIEALLAERADEIRARGVAVSVAVPSTAVTADRDGLAMALRNLLENALKFSRDVPKPMIEIAGHDTGTTCILSVRDNGTGFDMKYHDRIFDIFQRLHRSEDYPGTGIGLAIVKKAMERMGGRAWAESAPGKGATFYLEIPK